MNPQIEKHQCLIQILALIDVANNKINMSKKWYEKFGIYIPKANIYKENEITRMAIQRLQSRYNNQLKQLQDGK